MGNSTPLTQGGSKVKRSRQSTIGEGPVQIYVILTGISEQPDLRKRDFILGIKKTLGGFLSL